MVKTELPDELMNIQQFEFKNLDQNQSSVKANKKQNYTDMFFKDYMNKYRPINVWERMEKMKKLQGVNVSMEADFDELFAGIDPTDDLLNIQIHSQPESGRRKWFPLGTIDRDINKRDIHSLRRRFFELILHVMYWTRNKLVIMQAFRKKYRRSKLYKMGYMMSKIDLACKTFHRFAYRAIQTCEGMYYHWIDRFYPIEMLQADERMLFQWFDIELLIDLITENDESCKSMLRKYDRNRLQAWEFVD